MFTSRNVVARFQIILENEIFIQQNMEFLEI